MNNETQDSQNFWLGLEDFNQDPAFRKLAENEFVTSPLQTEDGTDGVARRQFLKLMGASLALATAGCVRRPASTIIPYAKAPKEIIPGIPNFYASSFFDGLEGMGALVKTHEGRPIKMEGNPAHPMNKGRLSIRGHAEVLSLYDPDRLKGPTRNLVNKTRTNKEVAKTDWEAADKAVTDQLNKADLKGQHVILMGSSPSPSTRAIVDDFARAYNARTVTWDDIGMESVREGQRRSYGRDVVPRYRMDKARLVVSIEADFLGTYLSPVEYSRQWAFARKPGKDMLRLVMFESNMSLTGLNADDRVRIRPSQQLDVVLGLIATIGLDIAKHPAATGSRNRSYLEGFRDVASRIGIPPEQFKRLADELWANRGQSLVIAGGMTTETADAVDLQVAVNMLNTILGNDGVTVDHASGYNYHAGSTTELYKLIADMEAGKVETVIINGINPIYSFADHERFTAALAKVKFVVSTANFNDETASSADFVLPAGTSLENWNDFEFVPGVYSLQQPTIRPLHDSRPFEESLLIWTKAAAPAPARVKASETWYDYVRANWRSHASGDFEESWAAALQTGVSGSIKESAGTGRNFSADALSVAARKAHEGFELVCYPTSHLYDGKYANVSWLQELPDPVTKIVWDNYVSVSPATAKKQDLREGDLVHLTVGKITLKVPVHIQPGLHDAVLAVGVGYGRTHAGAVGNKVGFNAFRLAQATEGGKVLYAGHAASFKKTGSWYELACTQGHHQLEGRNHVVETTLTNFIKDPTAGQHKHHIFSIWPDHKYNGHKWAMSIDLNACTGCSACVMACQTENNVPAVGKNYILQGREMHWIRIDRYYKGTPDNPQAVFEPMLCQQCETAPCETVCPVLATVHNEEGLNDMVYNRCVGTRYCSNNCPYKVRRFNWFNYAKRQAPLHMALNPDVTVRTRGVMEKCTFCVQRIRAGTNVAKDEKRALRDGEIQTACQQTCPTDAIVFGDLNNKDSAVARLHQDPRTFAVLEELNTQPRVRYQARIRNSTFSSPNILVDDEKKLHEGEPKAGSSHANSSHKGGHA